MVRETRHLWVGNLPDNIREDRIREHFKRYGRVQSVKLLPRSGGKEETSKMACTVAFMDIKSASKAHTADHKLDDRTLTTEYYEPAAIPSSSSPPNAAAGYTTTSPSNTRFPNGHSSSDEHGSFTECFYDRTNNSRQQGGDGEYIRRPPSYHDNGRGRNRDRGFRNGPPYKLDIIERRHAANNTWSTYEGNNSRYNNQANDTGYSTTPTDTSSNNDRRSEQSTKKKTKSGSGSRTPSPSGSASSRSPSRSRSRSSSSSSSSSVSRGTSSTGSPKSRRLPSSAPNQSIVHSEDRRPLAICVRNLPLRSSDTSLKDGLFHEYKKHGKVTWVKVVGQNSERHAIVCFKKPEDVDKAIEVSYDKLFFGHKIEVAPYQGYDVEDNDLRPYEAEIDEYHPKATRTLFIGNLEKDVTPSDLRKHFDTFGEIIEIDIKKQGSASSYAFCQYSDIVSVVKAIRTMDGEHLNNNRIKLGFGKSMPTACVWVDGVSDSVNDKYLNMQFDPFGNVGHIFIDREKGQALIFFDQVMNAQAAVNKSRGVSLRGRRIQVDFASRECQEAFFEKLEKQGLVFEKPVDDRRDVIRGFDNIGSGRFSRYETPTRPRTASYSGRSGGPGAGACQAGAIPSPGTPGSATPRGTGSRSRVPRYEYYAEQNNAEYNERHFRNYDEYSQGSAASHDDAYEHEYPYHESPSHVDPIDVRVVSDPIALQPFAQPDIRNLQKERVHLLEQLEDCHSSGDEVISPKKRLKLDHLEASNSDVIIEANRDHRKVTEVRRTSDASVKHLSRRPSVDGGKHVTHERGTYLPHAVCKRRKTAGSDSGRAHHYESSESVSGSRPGTPLCDERPEHFAPSEPRRTPREREGPLTLPLPRFASQMIGRASVSVAGIKGQKENVLSSPPAAVTSPRISNPKPPSPTPVPPPASPPPRPPSLSSNSSDSDGASASPSLDERIKSLDEKYEKWSGSRTAATAGLEALAKLDTTSQRFRLTRNLLDFDLREVQPSEIVKSVMAKRSVFDEDSKRLENVGEKYEPKDFNSVLRVTPVSVQTTVPATTLSTLPLLKVCTTPAPKTPTMLSPRSSGNLATPTPSPAGIPHVCVGLSTGAALTPAKGLQYPFPSHPPMQPSPSSSTPTTSPASQPPPVNSTTLSRSAHGDNRLKSCANAPNDGAWTSSKVNRNVSTSSAVVATKASDVMASSTAVSTPVAVAITAAAPPANTRNPSVCGAAVSECATTSTTLGKTTMCARVASSSNARRDSTISSNSSSENKSRRNSVNDNCDSAEVTSQRIEMVYSYLKNEPTEGRYDDLRRDRLRDHERDRERERDPDERECLEHKREELEKERADKEWHDREEKERAERLERERLEKERERRLERERKEREERERRERDEKERREEKERQERECREREEKERREREERERLEREREREREEKERREQEERERELLERERRERREKEEKERRDREEREKKEELERLEKERRHLEKDEERKHKEDNHDNSKKNDHRHSSRDNHSEIKHNRENNISASSKESERMDKSDKKDNHISSRNAHDKSRYVERREDAERRKESAKENRENNQHEKAKNLFNEIREGKDRPVEVHHASLDGAKFDSKDPTRRKERVNSLPATLVGGKRRISSHDSLDSLEETKKIKIEHRSKIFERRDSNSKKHSKNSSTSAKVYDDKSRHNHVKDASCGNKDKEKEKEKERDREREERHKNKNKFKLDQKSKSKSRDKESPSTPKSPTKELDKDKDFLLRFELVEVEKQKQQQRNKDMGKEERKSETRGDEIHIKKEKDYKCNRDSESSRGGETPSKDAFRQVKEEKTVRRIRKLTNSSDNSDSDEPKKHSIFDIVDDEPAYISMYDKVKARSCKNMQKQEEEKRQKIKAKFSQLKQSRAKREEKKRSTSWDEDSDSDVEKSEYGRRKSKILLASSDEDDGFDKPMKKEFSDSDSDCNRQAKSMAESSDDDIKNTKQSKSRITSDTSDDEIKLSAKVKSEDFSDNEDQGFADSEEKYNKKIYFEDRYVKKERKNNKHGDMLFELDSPPLESKEVKFNNRNRMYDSSEGESVKMEVRKKHRKKQKRSKNSTSGEESSKVDGESHDKQGEKRKQHSKKDKKRDKTKDERGKKSKKNRSDSKEFRRDGKMENIFGSLSDDSDVQKEADEKIIFVERFSENNDTHVHSFASDSDNPPAAAEHKSPERSGPLDKDRVKVEEKDRFKDEHRKRKERKRRDKEKRFREEQQLANDNSVDYSDLGKQVEDNIKDDSDPPGDLKIKTEIDESRPETDDAFRYVDIDEKAGERKETKERKKKRKKSKDEKQRHHHHHHHHDKNKPKTPEIKKEMMLLDVPSKAEVKEESTPETVVTSVSIFEPSNLDLSISPQTREPLISPIPKTPTSSKDKKREKFIAGFGVDMDEKIHENANAVKSISELVESPKVEPSPVPTSEDEIKVEAPEVPAEEKPPRVISQEETEDAVAALLGESFGSGQFDDYDPQSPSGLDSTNNETQDDEEMLQAVQSLNSSELEMKPETPQSENDLQIDTDTEEQEDVSIRYDTPKTPDMLDYSQPPKTPDISPTYFRKAETAEKNMPSISSPPPLTHIKQVAPPTERPSTEGKRNLDVIQEVKKPVQPLPPSLPVIATASSWTADVKPEVKSMPPLSVPAQQKPSQLPLTPTAQQQPAQPVLTTSMKEEAPELATPPPLKPVAKLPVTTHNMPAQLPSYPGSKEMKPSTRHSITPVVVPKSTQPTTHILQQPKAAQTDIFPQYQHGQFLPRAVVLQRPPLMRSSVYIPNTFDKPPPVLCPEPPKLASLSASHLVPRQGWQPVPQPDLPKLVPTTPTALPTTLSSSSAPTPGQPLPSIIISQAPVKQAPSSSFMPVIQEAPKLISQASTTQPSATPQVAAVATTTAPLVSSHSAVIQKTPSEEETKDEPKSLLKVKETLRTSTPSPVIVAPTVVKEEPKPTLMPMSAVLVPDPSKHLPIETVMEEFNVTLKKSDEGPMSEAVKVVKPVVKEEPKVEPKEEHLPPRTPENISVIKEIEKFDESKIIASSKEVIKVEEAESVKKPDVEKVDQNEDSKEDGDYWPAEINIDSVIRKVDALCSADLSDRGSVHKEGWLEEKAELKIVEKIEEKEEAEEVHDFHDADVSARGKRGGRARGKGRGASTRGGVQTRRGKAVPGGQATTASTRGRGRGGRAKTDRKVTKSESDDVYEFRDDSDENKDRPRLIMTIKGAGPSGPAANLNAQSVVKEVVASPNEATSPLPTQMAQSPTPPASAPQQPQHIQHPLQLQQAHPQPAVPSPPVPQIVQQPTIVLSTSQPMQSPPAIELQPTTAIPAPAAPLSTQAVIKVDAKDEFVCPSNTRKSQRLRERDVSRNTVDDTIEDVVKNTVLTRAAAAAAAVNAPRRSSRQTVGATKASAAVDNRKSPRGGKRDKKDRRPSEVTDDSSEESLKILKGEHLGIAAKVEEAGKDNVLAPAAPIIEQSKVEVREKPHEGLKAAMLRRVKGDLQQQAQQQAAAQPNSHESMTLIDPVTGLLTPMRECEEGRYIPLAGQKLKESVITSQQQQLQSAMQPLSTQPQPAQVQAPSVVVKQKPQSLKARVLNAQQQMQQQQQMQVPTIPASPATPVGSTPISTYPSNKPLNVNVTLPYDIPAHISPRPSVPHQLAKPTQGVKVIQPPLSPSVHSKQPQQIIQHVVAAKAQQQQVQQMVKVTQIVSSMVHMKQTQLQQQQLPKSPIIKHVAPPQTMGASPPLKQHIMSTVVSQRVVAKTVMEPPKVEVSIASGCVMVPRSNASPQGRHVIPVPAYEASMQHGDNRRRSPPPAHQNSPSPQGEGIAHYTPGTVRLQHDMHSHYIHPSLYQQYIRQQSYHLPRSPMLGIEKSTGDGQEGEEAPVTSPPLEMRRPGSVGIALTGRSNVPHSLQSPLQDRSTDSPQIGQAYGMHSNRVPHQLGRFYDSQEPPPAHRPLTSHGSLAALGSERSLGHLGALPDRPLSTHSALASHIERPLSIHTPDRPMSTHIPERMSSLGLGAVLGAAGNIMGAVARHVGDAPASQRGIQAATPPHASQVPPQAESLLMLLKQYPLMWQGLLALKNDQAAVQMYFVSGNDQVAKMSLPKNIDGSTPPLRIFQRMRLEPPQVEGVARKMQMENEHCMLLALPCGHDHMDVLKQSTNLTNGFITYLQHKQAAGIVNVAAPGTTQPPAYVVHIFPSCDFVNENLRRIAPSLLERVADIAHLLIVITTV